ncbi:MAG TPA: VCBS repeat-containing protein, partial [Polyangiaceae bacterium]
TSFKVYSGQAGASVLSGDFDGDGLTDFLATGVAGWTSIPIAFSNGDGTFNIQNVVNNGSNAFFAAVASQQGAKVVVGDFDGDGRDDLAATGGVQPNGQPWGTLPVALSNGDGTFTASNLPTTFQTYSQPSGMAAYAGDFDGDGRTDIAILGAWPAGLGSIPIAYSNGDGTFNVSVSTDWSASTFASVAGQQSARVVVGDFNGDGYDDFAATGGLQPDGTPWGSIPMAFSGGGTFTWHNAPSTFQTYSGQVGVRVESSWK